MDEEVCFSSSIRLVVAVGRVLFEGDLVFWGGSCVR